MSIGLLFPPTAYAASAPAMQPAAPPPQPAAPPPSPAAFAFPSAAPTAYSFPVPQTDFARQQILQNYNQDPLSKIRGSLARTRRKALLSRDPRQIASYFALASTLGIDPMFSAVGRQPERAARAEAKYASDAAMAQMFQPLNWLTQ